MPTPSQQPLNRARPAKQSLPPKKKQAEIEARIAAQRLARQQEQQRERLKRWSWWGGGIITTLLVIALIVHAVMSATTDSGTIKGVVTYANLARDHTESSVTYPVTPPVGGAHSSVWQNCGTYDQPIPNEHAVHSLEHGAIWITYQPTAPATTIATLRSLVSGHDHALLSPYPSLPAPIVISAWGAQLKVTTASDPRLAQFIQHYENSAQAPEANAACSGGTGAPVSA